MTYDLIIIGGGINGVGIARDAAGRGLKVLLCEQDDLASHTSSASTKLIHGGLRYLEHYDFGLVRKALQEREILLRNAPHIIKPLRFIMPYVAGLRPAWLIRLGLFLYDHLAQRSAQMPGSDSINLSNHPAGVPLKNTIKKGFIYSDAWVDDARLVVLNARDAADRGATILTRTKLIAAHRQENIWACELSNNTSVQSRILVNAAGPWVGDVLHNILKAPSTHTIRLVKGSHIITKRLFTHDQAYIFQHPDKRIIFAIPYENDFTLIGTTDIEYKGNPSNVNISSNEITYLCEAINQYFKSSITPADVISSYAGVRPLLEEETDNPSAVTRDYKLEFDAQLALLSVFGGKITTYRKLAEEALSLLSAHATKSWTENTPLPGGDIPNFEKFLTDVQEAYPQLPTALALRYARAYGTRLKLMLANGLGEDLGDGLYEAEVRYHIQYEWAKTVEDILWRRSKLGLHIENETQQRLEKYLHKHLKIG